MVIGSLSARLESKARDSFVTAMRWHGPSKGTVRETITLNGKKRKERRLILHVKPYQVREVFYSVSYWLKGGLHP
jgi:hypothetical protein